MPRVVASACAIALLSGVASAADLPVFQPIPLPPILTAPMPVAFNWTGFYVGGHGGWGFGQAPFVDGAVAGGQVGVQWDLDGFVVGAEADGSWVSWEGTNAVGTARLRGGFAFDRFHVYATGGAALQESDLGWVVGGGLDYSFTDNWTAGAEYLYYEFDDGGAADVFRGRVNYLFGGLAGALQSTPLWPVSSTPDGTFDWTGFYIGAHGGWSFVGGPGITDGYEVGGQFGVNRQWGKFVAGIEIDQGYVDWGAVTTAGSIRLRGGLAYGRFFPYVTAGMGIEDSIGWTAGAGAEYALTDHWTTAVATASPEKGAALFNEICQTYGRTHLSSVPDLDRFATLADKVLEGASMINAPIAAGWRALPRATDVEGRAQQLLHILRELRMARHAVCIHAEGLTPLEAIVAGPGGEANAKMFGWPEPFPDPAQCSDRRAAAEARTDQLSAVDFAVLSETERSEFLASLDRIVAHATK